MTSKAKKAKEYLQKYQIAKKKIEYYDKVLNDWEQERKVIVRMQKETFPGDQKRKEELDNLLVKVDGLRKTIIKEKDEDNEIIEEIQNIIEKITNDTHKEILQLRYVKGLEWHKISMSTMYCVENLHKINGEALDRLEY